MDVTTNQLLPFPEGNDPGDGALDLQVLAEAINANALAKLTDFRAIANKPCRIFQLSANSAGIAVATKTDITAIGASWVPLYANTGTPATTNAYNQVGLGTRPGIYHFGAFLSTNPTGAVTAGSQRRLTLEANIPNDPTQLTGSSVLKTSETETFDNGTASTMLTAEMEVFTPFPDTPAGSPFAGTDFNAFFQHANAGSSVQLLAGSLMWIYRASDMDA